MIVYVAGYPKSGTTWFTRLLGDALRCPSGGSLPQEDAREIATEGWDRRSDTVVRKGHFSLLDTVSMQPVYRPHKLHWKVLLEKEHRVVFVVRDPRDIAVSGAHHWKIPLMSCIKNMIFGTNGFRSMGPWTKYINGWTEKLSKFDGVLCRYEDMLIGHAKLQELLDRLRLQAEPQHVKEAYERQSFKNRVADIVERNGKGYNLGKEFNLRFMRKGIAGDWKNHFTRQEAFEAEAYFGELLRHFKYESDSLWWKDIR